MSIRNERGKLVVPIMLQSFFIFNKAGVLMFHHQITPDKTHPNLVGAFLSAVCSWAEMYSQSGVSLFLTGTTKFIFDRTHLSTEMIFCIVSTKDHDDVDLHEKMDMILENFVHFFWEERESMEKGIIPSEKMEEFRAVVQDFLK